MKIALFTIAAPNYLSLAKTMLCSAARHHPDYEYYFIAPHELPAALDLEDVNLIEMGEADLPDFRRMSFLYDVTEFCTALKPFSFLRVLKESGADAVIYLDPDILVTAPMEKVEKELADGKQAVVTPHVTRPLQDGKYPDDFTFLRMGVYNLGFLALARGEETDDFLRWWAQRLETQCFNDPWYGLFTDQKWCDLLPAFLEDVCILRDPGYNAAYWNLAHREIQNKDGTWMANGRPLAFFHFSGLVIGDENCLSKHQTRFERDDLPEVKKLIEEYSRLASQNGWEETRDLPYKFDYYDDGEKILPQARRIYREMIEDGSALGLDPFAGGGPICNAPQPGLPRNPKAPISRLMYKIWREREDLMREFTFRSPKAAKKFSEWFDSTGLVEHAILEKYSSSHVLLEKRAVSEGLDAEAMALADFLTEPAREYLGQEHPLSRIMHMLWNSDYTLSERFSVVDQEGRSEFIDWFLVQGVDDYGIEHALQRRAGVGTVYGRGLASRLKNKLYLFLDGARPWAREAIASRWPGLEPKARETWIGLKKLLLLGGQGPGESIIDERSEESVDPPAAARRIFTRPYGVNAIGYVLSRQGLGENLRMVIKGLDAAGVPAAALDPFEDGRSRHAEPILADRVERDNPYRINLVHVNADQAFHALRTLGLSAFAGRYNIGYWFWELEDFPDEFAPMADLFDEIWVGSDFVREAIAKKVNKPVVTAPAAVVIERSAVYGRDEFALPEEDYLFHFHFDSSSFLDRKNPLAVIEAFRTAFPSGDEKVGLVIKSVNASHQALAYMKAREAARRDPRIKMITGSLDRDRVISLIDSCDCYVSLHRAEGFGRGLAEAMYLGKPVIATGYSGNLDFTLPENSLPVGYKLVPIERGSYPRWNGKYWAEPDVEEAAAQMRLLLDDPARGRKIGREAARFIREKYDPAKVGALYVARFRELGLT